MMVSADRVPFCFADCCVLDIGRGVPIPGLTGSPSPLIVLAIAKVSILSRAQVLMAPPAARLPVAARGRSRRGS